MFTRSAICLSLVAIVCNSYCFGSERAQVQKFLSGFCVSCHGMETFEGGLRLDRMAGNKWGDPEILEDIYNVIDRGKMPPNDADKHPDSEQIKKIREVIGRQLQALAKAQNPAMLKRLSRVEYQNTVNDVFNTNFAIADQLPLDNIEPGFNNNADLLHMSIGDMETYFAVANRIAESVVGEKPEPRLVVYSTKNTDIDSLSHKDNTNGFAPSLERESRPLVFASPATQIKINPAVKTSGRYLITLKGFYVIGEFVPGSRAEERLPAVKNLTNVADDIPAVAHSMSYFLRKNSGVGQSIVTVIPNNAAWQVFDPREGFTTQLSADDTIVLRCNAVKPGGTQRMYCIESATISGPVYGAWPPSSSFYQDYCSDIDSSSDLEECESILIRLAQKLYRRPVAGVEMQQIFELAKNEFARGRNIYSGLQAGIRGMLCSPNFLYKQEGEAYLLNDYAIASRLSYFLWNSLPDDTLFNLARHGKLKDSAVRREQVLRMLQDVKSERFAKDYVYQWLGLEKLDVIEPDVSIFTVEEFDLVRNQIKEEPVEFFKEVLASNLSLRNFIDSDFVMITPELNYIYRIEGQSVAMPNKRPGASKISPIDYRPKEITSEFTKVALSKGDRRRGGLLTQAGFMLMTTNNGEYTNPFYRGAWVLKSFYGDHLETPADLEIAALKPPTNTASIKQSIDAHRDNSSCNACHRKMDPLGIALENYDVIGRWRDRYTDVINYGITREDGTGLTDSFPVDTKTVHMDGRTFEGPLGLKKILLEDNEELSRVFIEQLLSYALARRLTYGDREMLKSLCEQSANAEYRLRDILLSIITSESFARR